MSRQPTQPPRSGPSFDRKLDQLRSDLTQHVDLRFEEFRHDLLGAFRDALSLLSDKLDREHELLFSHEQRLSELESRR